MSRPSPRVEDVEWGRISVAGSDDAYKDAKVWPGGSREWDWDETGTRHVPGVQPADVEEIVERDVDVLLIGRGMLGALQVKDETREALTDAGVEIEVARTDEAVRRYNELRESRAVGALFHTTC